MEINENDIKLIVKRILKEGAIDFNLVDNSDYIFNYNELYQLYNDLNKINHFLHENSQFINNKPDLNDKVNRLNRSIKLINKKLN